jgi:HTH-type transcriptional regulator/antitoxin HipB
VLDVQDILDLLDCSRRPLYSQGEVRVRFTTPRELGLRVRDRRLQLGWSQAGLAKRVGMTRQWVIALEKGSAGAALGTVLRTLSELGLVLDVGEAGTLVQVYDRMKRETGPVPGEQVRALIDSLVDASRVPESESGHRGGGVTGQEPGAAVRPRTPLRRREQG